MADEQSAQPVATLPSYFLAPIAGSLSFTLDELRLLLDLLLAIETVACRVPEFDRVSLPGRRDRAAFSNICDEVAIAIDELEADENEEDA